MAKKYKFIDELKVGDNCYIFTTNLEGWEIKECKIVKIYREYSTWFKKECLVIEYLLDNNIKKDILQDEITHAPWIAGPLCADKNYAIKEANKINKSQLKKYVKRHIDLEKKYKQELGGLKIIIDNLNQLMYKNDKLCEKYLNSPEVEKEYDMKLSNSISCLINLNDKTENINIIRQIYEILNKSKLL